MDRYTAVTSQIDLTKRGLEVAPYFNPIILKSNATDIHYTDYISNEEIKQKAAKNPDLSGRVQPEIDFVWKPGSDIKDCIEQGARYSYIVASHVIEHVPDVLGWLNQLLSIADDHAALALVVPDRRRTMDFYRSETTPANLIDAWLRRLVRPSPGQIFDYLSRAVDDQKPAGERPFELGVPFTSAYRHYTDYDALHFALDAWCFEKYLDVHCTVWTPESFVHAMVVSSQLGIINVDVLNPIERENEFIIHLIKRGEAKMTRPSGEGSKIEPAL